MGFVLKNILFFFLMLSYFLREANFTAIKGYFLCQNKHYNEQTQTLLSYVLAFLQSEQP